MIVEAVDHDVVIVGDGPAGSALAASCRDVGLDVAVIGAGEPWRNTYGVWCDELPDLPAACFAGVSGGARVVAATEHRIDRRYGTLANDALRRHFGIDRLLVRGHVVGIEPRQQFGVATLLDGSEIVGGLVVDATGSMSSLLAPDVAPCDVWQTAYGVVVGEVEAAERFPVDVATLMDWCVDDGLASFCYVVPVADGWLVEETVLAARPAIEPGALRSRLVARLGLEPVAAAEAAGRVEEVRIPMASTVRRGVGGTAAFGAAAGFTHPATGYSVTASLRIAPRVAHTIAAGGDVHEAIWPAPARRARALHEYGLGALLRLSADDSVDFFDAFFRLPVDVWSEYLRVDTTPRAVAGAMQRLFRLAPWSVRRQLVSLDPRGIVGLIKA